LKKTADNHKFTIFKPAASIDAIILLTEKTVPKVTGGYRVGLIKILFLPTCLSSDNNFGSFARLSPNSSLSKKRLPVCLVLTK
ncbi:MAG TPA: hypothetical protein PK675_05680, partial [Clostridia bacterium]|nr:hypothetical protein [Clostridia bacterium]